MILMESDEIYIETVRLMAEQMQLNQKIEESGSFDDKDLEKQVEINTRRHELDIVDREEIIHKEGKKEFVQ